MEMCYSGALVMPSSYAVMDEDEMMYLEGGGSITINRKTINAAFSAIWSTIGSISTIAWIKNATAQQIGSKIVGAAFTIGKKILALGGFSGFAVQATVAAFAGVLVASAMTIGIVYATNSCIRLTW